MSKYLHNTINNKYINNCENYIKPDFSNSSYYAEKKNTKIASKAAVSGKPSASYRETVQVHS